MKCCIDAVVWIVQIEEPRGPGRGWGSRRKRRRRLVAMCVQSGGRRRRRGNGEGGEMEEKEGKWRRRWRRVAGSRFVYVPHPNLKTGISRSPGDSKRDVARSYK